MSFQKYTIQRIFYFAWACWIGPTAVLHAQNPFDSGAFDPGTTTSDPQSAFGAFGGPNSPMVPAAANQPAAAPEEKDPDPVVRMLRASPPKTPEDMADGLTWMVRIRRWDEVGRLLDQIQSAGWSLSQRAALARSGKSSLWVRLRSDQAELSDPQREIVMQILRAPAEIARDLKWIDGWIAKLGSSSAGERRLAQLRLQDGGSVAVQQLVSRLLSGDSAATPIMLAGTIVEFGSDGVDALQAACLVADPQRSARVLFALAELPSKKFTAELGAGLVSTTLPDDLRAKLAEILLAKYGGLPPEDAVYALLSKRFDESLEEYQMARSGDGGLPDSVWRLTPDRMSIQRVEVPAKDRMLERTSQLATLRMRLSAATSADRVEGGVVLLQRAYRMSPQLELRELEVPWYTETQADRMPEAGYWEQVFAQAGVWQMHGAAVRSLQMMGQAVNAGQLVAPMDFLSRLLSDPRPMIRYTALETVASIGPTQPYWGMEKAIETAWEMTQLAGGPHALVIGLQAELRQAAQQQLQLQTGADVTAVNSARAALLALHEGKPIELVVIVDRVVDQSIFELLQRLRQANRSQSLPIAVLTDQLYPHERQLIDDTAGVISSVLSRNAEQMERVVRMLLDSLDTSPMTAADRGNFAGVGGKFLATIAGDRERYGFYPVADWHDRLVNTMGGMTPSSRISLLAGLGSTESQRKLAMMTASGNLDEQERLEAAKAFGRSVRQFGMILSREDVAQSYDLYNQLGPTDPVAVKSIGLILDVMEAHAGKMLWPEGL